MYDVCFALAGLRLRVCSDIPVSVGDSFRPFLADSEMTGQDLLLTVQKAEKLPVKPKDTVSLGGIDYYREGDCLVALHGEEGGSAVCMTELGKGGSRISYLPGYAHWVSGTVGLFNRVGLESLLLSQDILLLHAALVRWKGLGILFSGPSGVGKSTQARLWEQHLGAEILNGDRAALTCRAGSWQAWGLPFAGTSHVFRNENAPIRALVVLRQSSGNHLRRLGAREAFAYVFPELSLRRWEKDQVDRALQLFLRLTAAVPVYLLECLPDSTAAELLYHEIKGEFSV